MSGELENVIVLSEEFYQEITAHPIPTDLEAVKGLAGTPAVLELFLLLSYCCFLATTQEAIPLFGAFGLVQQLGSIENTRGPAGFGRSSGNGSTRLAPSGRSVRPGSAAMDNFCLSVRARRCVPTGGSAHEAGTQTPVAPDIPSHCLDDRASNSATSPRRCAWRACKAVGRSDYLASHKVCTRTPRPAAGITYKLRQYVRAVSFTR